MSGTTLGFLTRNSLFIAKLVALIVLFFALIVWTYFAYAPVILESAPNYLARVDYIAAENARLSSLGSFLSALFQGNLGISYQTNRPVWDTLAASLEITVMLIILSSAIAVAVKALAMLVASRFKPGIHRQFASVFSRNGFFFALTIWMGLILFMIFSYYLHLFPFGHSTPDYWLIHPPENILVEIEGRLRHLALPLITLMIIFVIRSFFVVWSDGALLASGNALRRLLMSLTVADFACIVSAVVLVEYFFLLPGVGYRLLTSVFSLDLNVTIGAFIVLLGIGVILGCVGILFDLVQQRDNLGKELRNKSLAKAKEQEMPERKISTMPLRFLARLVLAKKSLLFGILIVLVFVIVGLIGPLLTPYHPLQFIAEPYSPPIWAGQLSPVYGEPSPFGILGTDQYGRDIFTQIVYSARTMLIIAIPLAIAAALIGLALGSAPSHLGKWADNIVVLFAGTTLALPILPILVVVSLTQFFGTQALNPLFWALLWVLSALVATASRRELSAHEKSGKHAISISQSGFFGPVRNVTANSSFVIASLTLLSLVGSFVNFQEWLGLGNITWSDMLSNALYSARLFEWWWLWIPPLGCILLFATGFFLIGLGLDRRL